MRLSDLEFMDQAAISIMSALVTRNLSEIIEGSDDELEEIITKTAFTLAMALSTQRIKTDKLLKEIYENEGAA